MQALREISLDFGELPKRYRKRERERENAMRKKTSSWLLIGKVRGIIKSVLSTGKHRKGEELFLKHHRELQELLKKHQPYSLKV